MKNYWKTAMWSMALILFTFMAASCGDDSDDEEPLGNKVYTLESVGGSGVGGTVTFTEVNATTTTVTIALTGNPADSVHDAHIHDGVKQSGGEIAVSLNPVANSTSVTTVTKKDDGTAITFDELLKYNGYVNIHASSVDVDGTVIATTNIGSNE